MSIPLFFDVSGGEFLIIMLVAFLVFGPKKLPEIARKLGRTMNQMKSISGELTREFKEETTGIANELKAARESAKINIPVVDPDKIVNDAFNQPVKKNDTSLKPPANDGVSKEPDNIEPANSVKREIISS